MSPGQAGEQVNYGCMRCGQQYEEYKYDTHCKTRLCEECFEYCKSVSGDKERPVIKKCQANHVMIYIKGDEDHYLECGGCHKEKIIKWRCGYCEEEDQQMFCFQCRPIRLETCYYQHPLKWQAFQGERQCHFCMRETNQFHYCRKCHFYACDNCVQYSLAHLHPDQPWEQPEEAAPGAMVKKEEPMEAEAMGEEELESAAPGGKREEDIPTAMDLEDLEQKWAM